MYISKEAYSLVEGIEVFIIFIPYSYPGIRSIERTLTVNFARQSRKGKMNVSEFLKRWEYNISGNTSNMQDLIALWRCHSFEQSDLNIYMSVAHCFHLIVMHASLEFPRFERKNSTLWALLNSLFQFGKTMTLLQRSVLSSIVHQTI